MLEGTPHTEKSEAVLCYALELMEEAGIPVSPEQQMTLTSHVCAMVDRSVNGGEIPFIDKEMFSEVSSHSIELAASVCNRLTNLVDGEKYLLSIHFESAKLQIL